jgi:hypothetical protein
MIGVGRTAVMSAQYERSKRMGSSRRAYTYIELRDKIKNKSRIVSDGR